MLKQFMRRKNKLMKEKSLHPEYDIYIDISKENIHLLIYLVEAEAHIMNIRKKQENGYFKIIVPAGLVDEAVTLLNSLKNSDIKVEVVSIEPHNGII